MAPPSLPVPTAQTSVGEFAQNASMVPRKNGLGVHPLSVLSPMRAGGDQDAPFQWVALP